MDNHTRDFYIKKFLKSSQKFLNDLEKIGNFRSTTRTDSMILKILHELQER